MHYHCATPACGSLKRTFGEAKPAEGREATFILVPWVRLALTTLRFSVACSNYLSYHGIYSGRYSLPAAGRDSDELPEGHCSLASLGTIRGIGPRYIAP
jgi:hypothetical protein